MWSHKEHQCSRGCSLQDRALLCVAPLQISHALSHLLRAPQSPGTGFVQAASRRSSVIEHLSVLQIVPVAFLRMFDPSEVNELLAGSAATGVDLPDLKSHTQLSGYSPLHPTVLLFWKVMKSFSAEERRAVLKFVTGTRRAPLGGFAHLQPPFTIAKVDCDASVLARVGGRDVTRLPTASTCFNTLKLPNYRRGATLRERLLYAVNARAGFDLS